MVLLQFIVTAANNNTLFPVGIAGQCSLRVLGIEYGDTENPGHNSRIIQIQSDVLYFPYSPAKFITFMGHERGRMNIDDSQGGFHLNNVNVNSGIRLNVIDVATGTTPANFIGVVLSLSIEEINRSKVVDA